MDSIAAEFSPDHVRPVPTARAYRPDIDGLRAIAVGAVLMFHAGVPGLGGGYVGVDVFFVISGYLITGHIAGDLAAGRFSILRFYERRIRRIVPALIATLLVTWLVALWMLLPSYVERTSATMIAAALSVANFQLWQATNYFAPGAVTQPLLHTWSLSVEEQFYAIIPILMLLVARPLRQRWALLFVPLCAASFALSVYATMRAPTANFYLLPTRAWELGLGSLLATVGLAAPRPRLAEWLSALGLALIVVPVLVFDESTPFPGLNALYPCLGAALLLHAGRTQPNRVTRALRTRPMVGIGLISYSLYLVHWPLIVFVRFTTLQPLTRWQTALVVVGSLALAWMSWRFVEQPFRHARASFTRARVLAGGVGALVLMAVIGAAGVRAHGFPGRFPSFAEQTVPGQEQWKEGVCFLTGNPDWHRWSAAECTRIATGPRRVLLWGDSFAAHYVPGILARADALQATLLQYTAAGCPPVLSYTSYARTLCTDFNRHALDIVRAQRIDLVVLSGRWTDLQHRGLGQIGTTLDALRAIGVPVVLIGQSPEFANDVQTLAFLKGSHAPDAVNRWRVYFDAAVNRDLAAIAAGRARFLDPMPATCEGMLCTYQTRGVFLFADYGHYSAAGSALAVQRAWLDPAPLLAQSAPQGLR